MPQRSESKVALGLPKLVGNYPHFLIFGGLVGVCLVAHTMTPFKPFGEHAFIYQLIKVSEQCFFVFGGPRTPVVIAASLA